MDEDFKFRNYLMILCDDFIKADSIETSITSSQKLLLYCYTHDTFFRNRNVYQVLIDENNQIINDLYSHLLFEPRVQPLANVNASRVHASRLYKPKAIQPLANVGPGAVHEQMTCLRRLVHLFEQIQSSHFDFI